MGHNGHAGRSTSFKHLVPRANLCRNLQRLARIRPSMLWPCLHACIVADYPEIWDELLISSSIKAVDSQTPPTESETQDLKL
jgi:hypothetical protein